MFYSQIKKVILLASFMPAACLMADFTWDGGGGNNNLNTSANWVGDPTAPVGDYTDGVLTFSGTARTSVVFNVGEVIEPTYAYIDSIVFDSTTTTGYTVSVATPIESLFFAGDPDTSAANSLLHDAAGNTIHTFSMSITTGGFASSTWTVTHAGSKLVFSMPVTLGYDLSGGNGTAPGVLTLAGAGDFTFSDNVVQDTNIVGQGITKTGSGTAIFGGTNNYTGATTISGGTLQIGNGGTTGKLSTSSSITNNSNLVFNRTNTITQNTDFANVISGSGNVTQAGSGTLVFGGTNTYTGATTISAGTLIVASGGSTYASSAVSVAAAGTLGGCGTVNGTVALSGALSPGDTAGAVGTLTTGAATVNTGSAMTIDFTGNVSGVAGTNWDLWTINGALNLNATSGSPTTLTLNTTAGLTGWDNAQNYSWKIMGATSVVGFGADEFAVVSTNFSDDNALGGGTFSVANVGNDVMLNFTAVPEPATIGLLALGAGALAAAKRRRS